LGERRAAAGEGKEADGRNPQECHAGPDARHVHGSRIPAGHASSRVRTGEILLGDACRPLDGGTPAPERGGLRTMSTRCFAPFALAPALIVATARPAAATPQAERSGSIHATEAARHRGEVASPRVFPAPRSGAV